MPDLEPTTEIKGIISTKFVRIGGRICYSNDPFDDHSKIAIENGVTEMVPMGSDLVPAVDDAGIVDFVSGVKKLAFFNNSGGTKLKDSDANKARKETIRVAKTIFGNDSISDTVSFGARPPVT